MQEHHLAAGTPELLQEQNLVGVFAGEAVRGEYGHDVDGAVADGVPERVQRGAVQAGTAVTIIAEHAGLGERVILLGSPAPQDGNLAGDGLLALLALGRNAGVDRSAHVSSPGCGGAGSVDLSRRAVRR